MSSASLNLNILFVPLDSTGHINACIGIAEQLVDLGHRVTFAIEASWEGKLKAAGFGEVLYVDHTRPPGLGPNEYWLRSMELIKDVLPYDSLYKAGHQAIQEFEELIYNELNIDDQLEQIIKSQNPDLIVVDNYVTVPAVYKSARKWVFMTSANPLSVISHPDTPPGGSGYPTNGDRSEWRKYEETFEAHYGPSIEAFQKRILALGLPEFPEGSLAHLSPYLNVYAYPEELDYLDIRPLPSEWVRFDHFVRKSSTEYIKRKWEIPARLRNSPGKLIYVSMGSMGCADKQLTERLLSIFSICPHRFIMVMGPNYGRYPLPGNVWAGEVLPQLDILPHVDLVLTHGGNNSVLETLMYGKPLLINPLFADQYDNAQRITEKQLGARVNAFTCEPEVLKKLIDKLLADRAMYERLERISKRLRECKSTEKVVRAIVALADRK